MLRVDVAKIPLEGMDIHQALEPAEFSALMTEIRQWILPTGRYLAGLDAPPSSSEPERSKVRAT